MNVWGGRSSVLPRCAAPLFFRPMREQYEARCHACGLFFFDDRTTRITSWLWLLLRGVRLGGLPGEAWNWQR